VLAFRTSLRRFQRWSEDEARAAGLTHVQHQLLVAIKGHPGTSAPTVGDLAGYLLLRPHSAVELVDRAEAAGLVRRVPDAADARVVRVELTNRGDQLTVLLALGGAEPHEGRDGEAFESWDEEEGRPPQQVPMPPDLPASGG